MEGLYAIVDPAQCRQRDPVWVGERILQGGCALLQLRAKALSGGELLSVARALAARCREAEVPFWINDHLDVALLVGADGLHLGQDDLPVREARKLWGKRPIGLSTHGLEQVRTASLQGADLIGFGPVFATRSKHDASPCVGLEGLRKAAQSSRLPVVAIGGITLADAQAVARSGARYAAAIGALCQAEDPARAARDLHTTLRST